MPIGTIINAIAVVVGSLIGLFLRQSFPEQIKSLVFDIMGLATVAIAIQMTLKMDDFLITVFSVLIGGIIGQQINIAEYLDNLADFVKKKIQSKENRFSEGLITAFLLYCIGPMTIIGSINEGLNGDKSLLLTKSVLDGFTSIAFASTFGIGVMFSAVPLFLFQSTLTILGSVLQQFFSSIIISQLTVVGGILILGIGLNLLNLKKIQVANLLPALIVVIILTVIFK